MAKEPIALLVPKNKPKLPWVVPEKGPSAGLAASYSGSFGEPDDDEQKFTIESRNWTVDVQIEDMPDPFAGHSAEFGTSITHMPGGDDGTTLPCPRPNRHFPALSSAGALAHFMSYSGSPKTIPIGDVDATPPQPFDFPAVLAAYNSGPGRYSFQNSHSNAVQTGVRSAEVLGRITFTLAGTLSVLQDGQFTFAGDIGVLTDTYDFDASNRDILSEISTFVGNQIPGKPFNINVSGAF